MKISKFTKRIVSFITALSLSISSTVMVLPVSAFTDDTTGQTVSQSVDNDNSSDETNTGNNTDNNTDNNIGNENDNAENSNDNSGNDDNNASEPQNNGDNSENSSLNDNNINLLDAELGDYKKVTAETCENGKIVLNGDTILSDMPVAFKLTPNDHYVLKENSLSIMASNGQPIDYTVDGDTYSFIMPSYDVTISAEFEQVEFKVYTSADTNYQITTNIINADSYV